MASLPNSVIGRGSISGAITPGIIGTTAGQVLRYTVNGPIWVTLTTTDGEVATAQFHPCSFCADPTSSDATKQGWHICSALVCTRAAEAQAERIYAGLFDSPETRQAALTWVKNRG